MFPYPNKPKLVVWQDVRTNNFVVNIGGDHRMNKAMTGEELIRLAAARGGIA